MIIAKYSEINRDCHSGDERSEEEESVVANGK